MVKSFLIFCLILLGFPCFSATNDNFNSFLKIPENYLNKVVSAIYVIEGSNKTKYPYGIKSIKTNNPKQICINTVRNQYIRWQQWGKTNSFEESLSQRYCPIGAKDDPTGLNKHWLGNLRKELARVQQ